MSDVMGTAISYTPQIIAQQLISGLNSDQAAQATLEQQLSTGDMINKPSDNPAGAADLMQLNASMVRSQQYAANASDGSGWLSLGNSTMNQILSALQQARQAVLSVSGANLSNQPGALQGLAQQVSSVRQELISLSNTNYGGQAIFAGTGNVTNAYDQNGNYVGGGSAPTRTVAPGVQVAVGVTGDQVFGSGTTGLLGSTGVLAQIVQDLQTGTTASLNSAATTDLQALDNATTTVTSQAAQMGANYQRMQTFAQQATNTEQALQAQMTGLDSTNVAQVSTQLTEAQQSYQSALWATSQLSQESLVQFLG
ncbi:MAG TPA: flagellin [Acidimicrobiales bacterium]|nr:flagellin [Acidimicrobiales bacterium]